jgi:hypothetical protein
MQVFNSFQFNQSSPPIRQKKTAEQAEQMILKPPKI